MAAATNSGSKDGEISAREAELIDRLLASAAGLPRVCCLKRCRRAKRCFGPDLVCLRQHRGLARARFKSALKRLGWQTGAHTSVIPGKEAKRRSMRSMASP